MKQLLLPILFAMVSLQLSAQTITPLYLNFNSHNEETDGGFGNSYNQKLDTFTKYRALLVQMCDTLRTKGAKYNFQSDWRFLDGVNLYDNGTASTNGKNVCQWMHDDNNGLIEQDVHAHKTQKNETDVVWYYQQIGITPSNVVGGFLYDTVMTPSMPGSNWTDMQDSLPGKVHANMKWQFDVIWGGGTPNHSGSDLNTYGAWKPDTIHSVFTHSPGKHLVLVGNGCSPLLHDSIPDVVASITNEIRTFCYEINNGQLPAGKFYTACIQWNVRDLSQALIKDAAQLCDSLQPLVDAGYIVWKNHTEKLNIWQNQYAAEPNQLLCDNVPQWNGTISTGIEESALPVSLHLFPNPTNSKLQIVRSNNEVEEAELLDMNGRKIKSFYFTAEALTIDVNFLSPGMYILRSGNEVRRFIKTNATP
ncbi:MAG: T9SS type A sorting domain-containing protein [Chitinophagales bacterium]